MRAAPPPPPLTFDRRPTHIAHVRDAAPWCWGGAPADHSVARGAGEAAARDHSRAAAAPPYRR